MTLHRTTYGETWDSISLKYYGTEKLMHLIMEANPQYSGYFVLPEGLVLEIPSPPEKVEDEELPPWKK